MSNASLKTLKDIHSRTKGWPVGVPADDRSAKALVDSGHLEYAAPIYLYPNNPRTYRLTTLGKLVIDGKLTLDDE